MSRLTCLALFVASGFFLPAATAQELVDEPVLFFTGRADQTGTANGGAVRHVLEDGTWRWWFQNVRYASTSPNGKQVAYVFNQTLHIADADGQNARAIFGAAHLWWPVWAPDGKRIACFTASQRREFDFDTDPDREDIVTYAEPLPEDPFRLTWTLVDPRLRVVDLDGEIQAEHVYRQEFGSMPRSLDWSPDGETIAYEKWPTIYGFQPETGLDAPLYDARRITEDPPGPGPEAVVFWEVLRNPRWHPDGEQLAIDYITGADGEGTAYNIATVALAGGIPVELTNNPRVGTLNAEYQTISYPTVGAWSPDGSELAYVRTHHVDFGYLGGTPTPEVWAAQGTHVIRADGSSEKISGWLPWSGTPLRVTYHMQWTNWNKPCLEVNDPGDAADADPNDGVVDVDLTTPEEQVTLRAAIEAANAMPEAADRVITFDIETTSDSVPVIAPASPLPTLAADSIVIDGTTQPGPGRVCIDGSSAGATADGITASGFGADLSGLEVVNFKGGAGIRLMGATNFVISGCAFGTDFDGTEGLGNETGIYAEEVTHALIGDSARDANIISGNEDGVRIVNGENNAIANSLIGTAPDGSTPLPNTSTGVRATGSDSLTIGNETAAPNVIMAIDKAIDIIDCDDLTICNAKIGVGLDDSSIVPGQMATGVRIQGSERVDVVDTTIGGALDGIVLSELDTVQLESLHINIDSMGANALASGNRGLFIDRSNIVAAEQVHIAQMGRAVEIDDSTEVEVQQIIIGTTRGGDAELPVDKGVVVTGGSDIEIGSGGEPSRIVAREGATLHGTSRAVLENIEFRLTQIDVGLLPSSELDVLIDDCEDTSFIGLVGAYAIAEHLKLLRSQRTTVSGSDFGGDGSPALAATTGIIAEDCDVLELTGNSWRSVTGNALTLDDCTDVDVRGNIFGTDGEGADYAIGDDAIVVTGASEGVEIIENILHNIDGATIKISPDTQRVIHRINEATDVIDNADRDIEILLGTFPSMMEGIYSDGSTRIDSPSISGGAPGQQVIIDVYAYPPTATGVEAHLYLGEHTVTYGPDGTAPLAAVIDGSAPPGWLLTFTITDDALGTSTFSPPVTRAPAEDSDNDGIPDFFERQHPGVMVVGINDAGEDPDEDGRDNITEFLMGTDPGAADLSPTPSVQPANGATTVHLPGAKSGRVYRLQRSTTLARDSWQSITSQFLTHSGELALEDSTPPADNAFYRIVSELP